MTGSYFSGRVQSVVFSNPTSQYYVLRCVLDQQKDDSPRTAVVAGYVPGLKVDPGTWFGFEAKWVKHPKYGWQLEITRAPIMRDLVDAGTARSMLTAHGVGGAVCDAAIAHLGEDNFVQVLRDGDIARLESCPGMTRLKAAHMIDKWRLVTSLFKTLEFLSEAKVPKSKISRVWATFGDKAQEVLSTNPWALVRIDGITFAQADEVALRLGLNNPALRVRGAALYACKNQRGNFGHLYLTLAEAVGSVQDLVGKVDVRQVVQELVHLHKQGDIVLDRKTRPGVEAVYEQWSYKLETECAEILHRRVTTADPSRGLQQPKRLEDAIDRLNGSYPELLSRVGDAARAAYEENPKDVLQVAAAALEDVSHTLQIKLTDDQMVAALNALTAPVSILTGLPGTGKTATLNTVVQVLRAAGVHLLLVAPTGIAAKRMEQVTRNPASTVHRAFGAQGQSEDDGREATYKGIVGALSVRSNSDGQGEQWEYGPEHPHPARVVICDEASMLDQHMLYRILSGTHDECRLVFVGDAAQLPSVGAGNVLRDMIESKLFPTANLTKIFRQESTSDIVVAAHAVFHGQVPPLRQDKKSEFVHINIRREEDVLRVLIEMATRLYEQRRNFQVISPRHGGVLGVTNLNDHLRAALNPGAPGLAEMKVGSERIREGDRVMVVQNDYSLGIYNGDVGKVAKIDISAKEIVVKLHDARSTHVRIGFDKAALYLRLAYAMTIHKVQGQEYDNIVLPFVNGFAHQLQRNLFYTAITRAKKRVYLLGHPEAVARAVHNAKEDVRNTMFQDRLKHLFEKG